MRASKDKVFKGALRTCRLLMASAYAVGMPKTPITKRTKIIPITEGKRSLIATDEKSKRFILAVGKQRIAFDFITRVTELTPYARDQPAPVLPIKSRNRRPPDRSYEASSLRSRASRRRDMRPA
jgi:hypothetical protein